VFVQGIGIGIGTEKSSGQFGFNSIFTNNGKAVEKRTESGLSLCKKFVERNDDKIWVESELGKRSKFTFNLQILII
jgi:light-regulated signal transduction histidine kinase (bacteriophytochrome)